MIKVTIKKDGDVIEKTTKILGWTIFKKIIHPLRGTENSAEWMFNV
jgi:hypothetical protein